METTSRSVDTTQTFRGYLFLSDIRRRRGISHPIARGIGVLPQTAERTSSEAVRNARHAAGRSPARRRSGRLDYKYKTARYLDKPDTRPVGLLQCCPTIRSIHAAELAQQGRALNRAVQDDRTSIYRRPQKLDPMDGLD